MQVLQSVLYGHQLPQYQGRLTGLHSSFHLCTSPHRQPKGPVLASRGVRQQSNAGTEVRMILIWLVPGLQQRSGTLSSYGGHCSPTYVPESVTPVPVSMPNPCTAGPAWKVVAGADGPPTSSGHWLPV